MIEDIADELMKVVDTSAQKLKTLDEVLVSNKPAQNMWSIQQILARISHTGYLEVDFG